MEIVEPKSVSAGLMPQKGLPAVNDPNFLPLAKGFFVGTCLLRKNPRALAGLTCKAVRPSKGANVR